MGHQQTAPVMRTAAAEANERLVYSHRSGRVRLRGVTVRNAGIDWEATSNCFWQHKVQRREAVRIVLHGQAEFEASHLILEGSHTFEVGTETGGREGGERGGGSDRKAHLAC